MKAQAYKIVVLTVCLGLFTSIATAQYVVITADEVQDWLGGKRKPVLIDVRTLEEYKEGHIPGAINIPAERISAERARLPKDKSAPVIFYCRGVG